MLIFTTLRELTDYLAVQNDFDLGFVPTMGALHEGHGSLIRQSVAAHKATLCSIYVNPAQFNDIKDFTAYPKTPEQDLAFLKACGCTMVFIPQSPLDLSSIKPFNDLGHLNTILEAPDRPGHFEGVCKIVEFLFTHIKPKKAYFGRKDYQQIAVIQKLIQTRQLQVELVECPTCREPNGLAMSSRNRRLNSQGLALASNINLLLMDACKTVKHKGFAKTEADVLNAFTALGIPLHYAEFRCISNLHSVNENTPHNQTVFLLACTIQGVRLLDNMFVNEVC